MDFSEKQLAVLSALEDSRESILLTGVAGCGKSTILRQWLKQSVGVLSGRTIVLAPTGIAALNVQGSTIHRAFGFMPGMDTDDPRISLKVRSLLYNVDTIVIDEISMVRADLLHAMDIVLRSVKHKQSLPFGGVRMIFVGDFYQLPPVVRQEEERWLDQTHGSRAGWCFLSPCFQALAPKVFYLAESFRQAAGSFADLLNAVRALDPSVIGRLNELAKRADFADDSVPRLCATKKRVQTLNEEGLRRLGRPILRIDPVLTGDTSKIPNEEKDPAFLAEGARVMITRNGAGYVNGSLGRIVSFEAWARAWDGAMVPAISVQLDKGYTVEVPRETAEVLGYEPNEDHTKVKKTVLAEVNQFPLALAYGWTIHKSQGQTLDAAVIDLGRGAFAHGQTYVALSRLTRAEGLYLAQPLTREDLLLDPDVIAFCREHTT